MSDYISEDYLVQILKLLPVKPLLRFRCVCKWWKEIIDSQSFIQQHLALQNTRLLVSCDDTEFIVVDAQTLILVDALSKPVNVRRLHVVGTHHGLVCLHNERANNLVLWNPSIRKSRNLSIPEIMQFEWQVWDGEDHNESYSSFWIDPSDKCYKIIIFKLFADGVNGFHYSSIQQDWSVVTMDEVRRCRTFDEVPRVSVMIRGVAYWRVLSERVMVLLSLDFVHERFDIVEVPHTKYSSDTGNYPEHCNLHDTLSLVYSYYGYGYGCISDIYSRKEGTWVNMFSFKLLAPYSWLHVFFALEETEESCRVLAKTEDDLVLYDAKGVCIAWKSVAKLNIPYKFVESLLFP